MCWQENGSRLIWGYRPEKTMSCKFWTPQRWAGVHCTPCTPSCYTTDTCGTPSLWHDRLNGPSPQLLNRAIVSAWHKLAQERGALSLITCVLSNRDYIDNGCKYVWRMTSIYEIFKKPARAFRILCAENYECIVTFLQLNKY